MGEKDFRILLEKKAILIDSVDVFIKTFITDAKDNLIFRGVSDIEQLLPGILRGNKFKSIEGLEMNLLANFEFYCGLYEKISNHFEMIALAQHYGLKTRLIDFTDNPLVSLFFSLYKKSSNYYIVQLEKKNLEQERRLINETNFILNPKNKGYTKLIRTKSLIFNTRNLIMYFKKIKAKKGKYIFLDLPYNNDRRFNQQGNFIIPTTLNEDDIFTFYCENSTFYKINTKIRNQLLTILDKLGFDEIKMFGGLETVCNVINADFENPKTTNNYPIWEID